MPIDAVVGDANVLPSATVGKAALRVINEYRVRVHISAFNAAEAEAYLPRLSTKYDLPEDLVQLQWRLLSVEIHAEDVYSERLPAAEEALGDRDPEDAHALALAWALDIPLWSNDRDFEDQDVERYTTATLLAALEREGRQGRSPDLTVPSARRRWRHQPPSRPGCGG